MSGKVYSSTESGVPCGCGSPNYGVAHDDDNRVVSSSQEEAEQELQELRDAEDD